MVGSNQFPPITIITGPRESGRTTYAVMVGSGLFRQGYAFHHNGTALIGWVYPDDYLKNPEGLLRLAQGVPENTPILIEEADIHSATRRSDNPAHDATIASALTVLADKSCYLILTTVQGAEHQISQGLVENAWEHVTPYMNAESKENLALATIHRFGRRLIPVSTVLHDQDLVHQTMAIADAFRETRSGAPDGTVISYSEDQLFEVPQTSIDQMKYPKYPEYPVHYRHRIIRKLRNEGPVMHRLSQASRLNFVWLESVNEHPHETQVLEMLRRTMPQWGFEYQPVHVPQNDRFPDGRALINGESTNLEVVSIQPRYPQGYSLHDLVAMSQTGRTPEPRKNGILRCSDCRTTQEIPGATLDSLPVHDENHKWVFYLPNPEAEESIPVTLTVTPLITITQEGFNAEVRRAVENKSRVIADQGAGHRNWVVVIAQGFPVEPQWYSELPDQWPDNVDGIVIAATDQYLSASHDFLPYHDLTMVLLKCSQDADAHNCYHPSYLYRVSHFDEDLQPISPDTHSVEDLSAAVWHQTWPSVPTRRTLIVRDEDENEIDRLEDIAITRQQASEVLQKRNFMWRQHGATRMVLVHEPDGTNAQIWAEVEIASDGNDSYWTATAYREIDQFYQETAEEFETKDAASQWCEVQIATTLLNDAY